MTIETVLLSDEQSIQLNEIYTRIARRFTTHATDSVNLPVAPAMSVQDAVDVAEFEFAAKRRKIVEDYNERVQAINANAANRGLAMSSTVLQQLDKALVRKNDALADLEGKVDKYAKKLLQENQKWQLSVEREKSTSRSRAMRDFIAYSRMKLTVNVNVQQTIDEELYNAYLEWLLKFTPQLGLSYAATNPLFLYNMGATQYAKLLNEMTRRAEGV